jgi:F-type H+-transporting ATPase subunit b
VIEINWTLFMQMINFLVLLFILNHLLYKPILKIIDERKKKINEASEECKSLDQKCEERLAIYKDQLQKARLNAIMQKEEIKTEGIETAKRLIEKVKEEADRILVDTTERIQREVVLAREALRRQAREMAVDIAEKLVGRKLQ